jgi:hypothetical protein
VTIHVQTNTTNVQTQVTPGATNTTAPMNSGQGNAEFDGFDGTLEPPCDNKWDRNGFGSVNQTCVAAAGRGQVRTPRGSGKPRPSDFKSTGAAMPAPGTPRPERQARSSSRRPSGRHRAPPLQAGTRWASS